MNPRTRFGVVAASLLAFGCTSLCFAQPVSVDWDIDGVADQVSVVVDEAAARRDVRVVSGASGEVLSIWEGSAADMFGWRIADTNMWLGARGAGVLICAPFAWAGSGTGRVYFYHSSAREPFRLLGEPNEVFGVSARMVADVNGDLQPDICIGSLSYREDGVELYIERIYSGVDGRRLASQPETTYVSWVPGDADGNAVVEVADIELTMDQMLNPSGGSASGTETPDASLNGRVDGGDLEVTVDNLGTRAEITPEGAALAASFAPLRQRISLSRTMSTPRIIVRPICGPGTNDPLCIGLTPGSVTPIGDFGETGPGGSGPGGGYDPPFRGSSRGEDLCGRCSDGGLGWSGRSVAVVNMNFLRDDMFLWFLWQGNDVYNCTNATVAINGSGVLRTTSVVNTNPDSIGEIIYSVYAVAPGRAKITISGVSGECRTTAEIEVIVISADIDIDSDNNNGVDMPSGSEEEERLEEAWKLPGDLEGAGKTVLSSATIDSDGDGIPDSADGYDGLIPGSGSSFAVLDDESAHGTMVPLVIRAAREGLAGEQVFFSYAGSDHEIPHAELVKNLKSYGVRLWTKPPNQIQKGRSVEQGGDIVPHRKWIDRARIPSTLWVESTGPLGKNTIEMSVRFKNPFFGQIRGEEEFVGGESYFDSVAINGIEVRLFSVDPDGTRVPRGGFVGAVPGSPTPSGILPGPQPRYQVEIFDPRLHTSDSDLKIGGQRIGLSPTTVDPRYSRWWKSPLFSVSAASSASAFPGITLTGVAGPTMCEWNPEWRWFVQFFGTSETTADFDKVVVDAVESSVLELESEKWKHTVPPSGAPTERCINP